MFVHPHPQILCHAGVILAGRWFNEHSDASDHSALVSLSRASSETVNRLLEQAGHSGEDFLDTEALTEYIDNQRRRSHNWSIITETDGSNDYVNSLVLRLDILALVRLSVIANTVYSGSQSLIYMPLDYERIKAIDTALTILNAEVKANVVGEVLVDHVKETFKEPDWAF